MHLHPLMILAYLISLFEFCLNALCIPLSALNFHLIRKTAVLHVNLRCLLLFQSLAMAGYAMASIVDTGVKVALGSTFHSDSLALIYILRIFGVMVSGLCGNFITLERILATLLVRRYEKAKTPYLAMASIALMVGLWIEIPGA